jgi:hypothetical protein
MSNAYRDRLLSVGYLSRGRTGSRVLAEGRAHPESGEPYKTVRDELGHDVTEHGKAGAGVSDRQDVNINVRGPITAEVEVPRD